ncbi:hypothetical protein PF006_g6615 [Phytophthora fragariae]|uniref:Helicase-associated domain-containing protein n=1 Tax=Phytophthora fragariae TaxID=53985 RepID=A0A6A3UP62_9STRA|nr:hypothetical protein PF006_g6615 [Phytophthora fragariae]
MLRLVSSARSRLLRAGVVRAAGAVAHESTCTRLDVRESPFLRSYGASRLFSTSYERYCDWPWGTRALNDPNAWQWAVNNSMAWQKAVKPSLLTFLELKKHLIVPVAFVVPHGDEAWPRVAWGYPLGKHAMWLRKKWREGGDRIDPTQRKELDEMPFAWDPIQYKWDRFVLPALRRFYELNGHTDVAREFVIPKTSAEWPEHLWGQRLGFKVMNIRKRGDFAKQVEADKDELERVHFCHDSTLYERNWREKVIPALRVFRQEFGHCNVSSGFTVPSHLPWPEAAWEMNLGYIVQMTRGGSISGNQHKRELEELGFVWDFYEFEWSERIMPALEIFHRLEGHCRVPNSFVVPSDDNWLKVSWDLKLGNVISGIRSKGCYSTQISRDKTRLEELGFVWDFYEFEWSERIMPALETFHRLEGHCRVPNSFVVPSDDNWLKVSWDLKLGNVVRGIRSKGSYSTQISRDKTRLEELGFVWDFNEYEWSERVMPALESFHRLEGHCRVPKSFVVPSDDNWPIALWGLKVGNVVRGIRSKGSYSTQISRDKTRLKELGFVWDFYEYEWSERIMPALETFHRLEGHCRVPKSFVVPSDENWPIALWGLKIGNVVSGIRSKGSYSTQISRDKTRLEELGFVWDFYEFEWSERIMPALETFHRLEGHCRVPNSFVVPSDDNWLKVSWDLKLGNVVRGIRSKGSYSTQISRDKTRLEELGFVWDFNEYEWSERVMPALESFHRLEGHCRVPKSFVVPSDENWPIALWGLKIGNVVSGIRSKGCYSTQISRNRTRLEELGFQFRKP